MDEVADTRQSYDLVAERYSAEIGGELADKPLDRSLLAALVELAAGGPVVDVGCGPGHVTARLANSGASAVGLDLSPAMCAIAHQSTRCPFVTADMAALPFRSNSLAGIACFYALIHLDGPPRAETYQEFARVLRPGGSALVAFHASDADVAVGGHKSLTGWWGHQVQLTFRFLDPAAEARAMAEAGLELMARMDRAAA